jgi:hypothetical protein
MRNLISCSGRISSGKDTVCSIIQYLTYLERCKELKTKECSFEEFKGSTLEMLSPYSNKKMAGKLKQVASILTGIPVNKFEDQEFKKTNLGPEWDSTIINIGTKESTKVPTSIRTFLQRLGTEAIRNGLHTDSWLNAFWLDIDPFLNYSLNTPPKIVELGEVILLEKLLEGKGKYKCFCGKEFITQRGKIKSRHTKSCGCYQKSKAAAIQYKDGRKGTRLWSIYNNMIQRCENINHPRFNDYGGRGIVVSDEFKPFENFKKWAESNGYNDFLSIDRIDCNDIYCSDNCTFSNDSEQAINTRNRKDNTSGFRGVSKEKGKWRANIQIDKKQLFLGYYETPEEASKVYEKEFEKRKKLYESKYNKINHGFIITDCRFENEYNSVKERGGLMIKVERPLAICGTCGKTGTINELNILSQSEKVIDGHCKVGDIIPNSQLPSHASETGLDHIIDWDYVIHNDSDIPTLIEKVKIILIKEKII